MMITPKVLKEFVCKSLSPEFLKDKEIEIYYDYFGYPSVYIDKQIENRSGRLVQIFSEYYSVALNYKGILLIKRCLFNNCKQRTLEMESHLLSDPNASEKIREFFEKDPP